MDNTVLRGLIEKEIIALESHLQDTAQKARQVLNECGYEIEDNQTPVNKVNAVRNFEYEFISAQASLAAVLNFLSIHLRLLTDNKIREAFSKQH